MIHQLTDGRGAGLEREDSAPLMTPNFYEGKKIRGNLAICSRYNPGGTQRERKHERPMLQMPMLTGRLD